MKFGDVFQREILVELMLGELDLVNQVTYKKEKI